MPADERGQALAEFGRMALVHFLALGRTLDVTREHPDLVDLISAAERDGLLEVDVPRASHALSAKGRDLHAKLIREAQELVLRYDVFGDVETSGGMIRFDSGLGQDLRVAVLERDGIDPFRARFLVGLNDGEWDDLADWPQRIQDPGWYDEVFAPIEQAPGVEDVGAELLERVVAAGHAAVREDEALRR